jgi:hypothetical protein
MNYELHRVGGPAHIDYNDSNTNRYNNIGYYYNGVKHCVDGPAIINWYPNGDKWYEEYYIYGDLHCIDGPAYKRWYKSKNIAYEAYYVNAKLHRIDGPAIIEWYNNTNDITIIKCYNNNNKTGYKEASYYINGEFYKTDIF